jgi:hypothetical protein
MSAVIAPSVLACSQRSGKSQETSEVVTRSFLLLQHGSGVIYRESDFVRMIYRLSRCVAAHERKAASSHASGLLSCVLPT